MAKKLTQVGIETGNTVEAFHVTQSINAFTGTEDYDISLSGSLNVTGSVSIIGLSDTAQSNVITINTSTGKLFFTASSALDTTIDTSSFVTNSQTSSFVTTSQTGSYLISASSTLNNIHFTSSNGSTFDITVDTGSSSGGGGGASIDTGSFYNSSSISYNTNGTNTITFNQGDNTTENVIINTGVATWYTASSTLFNIPQGNNVGVYINYNGSAQVTLDLPDGVNIGDSVEIVTQNSADGKITVDYDTGQIRAWSTGSADGGSITQNAGNRHPTMKLVYIGVHSVTSTKSWNLVRYMDDFVADSGGGAGAILDSIVFQNT